MGHDMDYQMRINVITRAIRLSPRADVMSGLAGTGKAWSVSRPLHDGGRLVLHEAKSWQGAHDWARAWEIREQAEAIATALMPRESGE